MIGVSKAKLHKKAWTFCTFCGKNIFEPVSFCPHCDANIDRQLSKSIKNVKLKSNCEMSQNWRDTNDWEG